MKVTEPDDVRPDMNEQRTDFKDPRSFASMALAALAIGALLVLFVGVLFTRVAFGKMFDDFQITIPWITRLVLSPVVPVLLGVLLVGTLAKEFFRSFSQAAILWNVVALVGAFAFAIAYFVGMWAPLVILIELLSK